MTATYKTDVYDFHLYHDQNATGNPVVWAYGIFKNEDGYIENTEQPLAQYTLTEEDTAYLLAKFETASLVDLELDYWYESESIVRSTELPVAMLDWSRALPEYTTQDYSQEDN